MSDRARSYEYLALSQQHLTGHELRILRRQLGLSQRALASLLGVAELTVTRWENRPTRANRCVEALIRLLYLEHIGKPVKIMDMLTKIMPVMEDASV